MSHQLDNVRMSVSGTPGSGDVTLGSAIPPAQAFSSAGVVNGYTYTVRFDDTGNAWEVSTVTYSTSGPTLTGRTLIASSTGSLLSLTSAAIVSQVQSSRDMSQLIGSITASGTPSSVTFSNIPGTFKSLRLLIRGKCSEAGSSGTTVKVQFNGDTTGTYNYFHDSLVSTGVFNASGYAATAAQMSWAAQTSVNAAFPGLIDAYIHGYADTNWWKQYQYTSQSPGALANPNFGIGLGTGLWQSTAAINSINIAPNSGTWSNNSTFQLYGLN